MTHIHNMNPLGDISNYTQFLKKWLTIMKLLNYMEFHPAK